MKKHSTSRNRTSKPKGKAEVKERKQTTRRMATRGRLTVGLDLGERHSRYCILDEAGEIVSEGQVATTQAGWSSLFAKMPASRVALEVGTHSPWVSRHLGGLGHEVIVANAHKVKLLTHSVRKNDRLDAEQVARRARVDPKLLSPMAPGGGSPSGSGGDPSAWGTDGGAHPTDQQCTGAGETEGGAAEGV